MIGAWLRNDSLGMNPGVLVIITADPRTSPRPAEAVRIAAGLGAWQRVVVTLYLRAAAVLVLSEHPDELVDGDLFRRYLPLVPECGGEVCAQRGAPLLKDVGEAPVPFREINDDDLAGLASENDYLIRF